MLAELPERLISVGERPSIGVSPPPLHVTVSVPLSLLEMENRHWNPWQQHLQQQPFTAAATGDLKTEVPHSNQVEELDYYVCMYQYSN